MTWIFFPPSPVRMTSNSVFSSSGFGSSAATGGSGNGDSSSGGNAPCFFEGLGKVGRLEDGQLRKFFNKLGDIGHVYYS